MPDKTARKDHWFEDHIRVFDRLGLLDQLRAGIDEFRKEPDFCFHSAGHAAIAKVGREFYNHQNRKKMVDAGCPAPVIEEFMKHLRHWFDTKGRAWYFKSQAEPKAPPYPWNVSHEGEALEEA